MPVPMWFKAEESRKAAEEAHKRAVWVKGTVIKGRDISEWRVDGNGNLIRFSDHGNRDSNYGWEIDHIIPTARGGSDTIDNLRPLHWRANAEKNDSLLGRK